MVDITTYIWILEHCICIHYMSKSTGPSRITSKSKKALTA